MKLKLERRNVRAQKNSNKNQFWMSKKEIVANGIGLKA